MKVGIVGGGISGLTAAYILAQNHHEVTVFEKSQELGGLVASFTQKGWQWPLEHFYHHFFSSDQELFDLAKKLKIENKLFFKKPKTSIYLEGKIYRFDNPQSILSFPKLNLFDKFRTGLTTAFLKVNPFWQPLEKITAQKFLQMTMGKKTFKLIWEPLLQSKFGPFAQQIPTSWFWTRIKKRSFALGYFEGGTNTLISSLKTAIEKNGGQVLNNQEVTCLKPTGKKVEITVDQKKQSFDQILATVSPQTLLKITPSLKGESFKKLQSIGSLCLVLELKESFLKDKTYWLNINESSFPFVAVVEHTNYIDKSHYNNEIILYVGGYYPTSHPFFKMNKEEIYRKFLPYLEKINPNFNFKLSTLNFELFTENYAQPVPGLNHSSDLPSIKTSLPGLYWCSLDHVYPEDRGVNYAIKLGKEVANEILKTTEK